MYYRKCEYCGSNLDPNERFECLERKLKMEQKYMRLIQVDANGQLKMEIIQNGPIRNVC